jgi:DNA-binding transcriptional ArsR family regulator
MYIKVCAPNYSDCDGVFVQVLETQKFNKQPLCIRTVIIANNIEVTRDLSYELTDTLAGIELAEEGLHDGKPLVPEGQKIVRDEEIGKIMLEPVRSKIMKILHEGIKDTLTKEEFNEETGEKLIREKTVKREALSVAEIVNLSEERFPDDPISKNQVYHHLPLLIEGGYVVKFGTVTKGKRTTDYYIRTHCGFIIATEPSDKEYAHQKAKKRLEGIMRSFALKLDDDQKGELENLMGKVLHTWLGASEEITGMVTGDVADKSLIEAYNWLLDVYAADNKEYLSLMKKIRAIIFPSLYVTPVQS